MNEEKKRTRSVTGRGLLIILLTLMLASTAWACKIGDLVWYDVDKDGVQDTGEAGVIGVIVTAYDCDTHEQMGTATTDEYGLYEIAWPSIPRPFYLVFVLPDEMVQTFAFTVQDRGGNDGLDSDVDALGWTECFEWPQTDPWIQEIWDFDAGIVEKAAPCGECKGKVTQLTLQYNGTSGATIKVTQKKGEVVFEDYVGPGESFTFDGTDKNGTLGSEISIYVNGTRNAKIHTSCSQPIGPGLVRGDFEVVEGYSKDGGRLCPVPDCGKCEGKVTRLKLKYEGSSIADIMVVQKKGITVVENVEPDDDFTIAGLDKDGTFGTEISIHVGDDPVPAEIHTSCSQPIGPGMRFGPFLIVEGYSLKGGRLCPVEPEPPAQGCGCDGKVTRLTLQYNGDSVQPVVILQKKDDDPVFDEYVEPGAQITFSGQDKNGTLGTEISIYVGEDAELHTKIHTSCSQPIGPGLIFGDFEVIEGYSLKGGPLCPFGKDD